ncbi:MAG: nucleotide exchange factor GrpE [Clostridia bacterium]|nr:nucleotide exchange factor GrpE [Clostridia bacterium]
MTKKQKNHEPEEILAEEILVEEISPENDWQERLAKAEAEREEYLDLAQRVQADFDNFRKRNQSVRAEAMQDGANEVLTQLLPVVDNLERAVEAVPEGDHAGQMREGVALVLRQLLDMMGKFGVTEINRLGETFDPMLENAVTQGAPEEGEPGTVCEVFQKGYQTPNKVLRYAMVKVVAG